MCTRWDNFIRIEKKQYCIWRVVGHKYLLYWLRFASPVKRYLRTPNPQLTPQTLQIQDCYSLNPKTRATLGTRHRTKPQKKKKKRNNIHNTENIKDEQHHPHHEKVEKVVNQVPRELFLKRHPPCYSHRQVHQKSFRWQMNNKKKPSHIIYSALSYNRDINFKCIKHIQNTYSIESKRSGFKLY